MLYDTIAERMRKKLPRYITRVIYLRNTLISLSSESSLPFNAFLSIIFTAYMSFGRSLLTANRTSEKAPL